MRLFCLSNVPNKPCYVLSFKGVNVMLDCSLDISTVLNFMPIPLVHSSKLTQLPRYMPRDGSEHILDGELRESSIQGRVFVDSPLEFGVPDSGLIDFGSIDVILISNYTTMMALPYITEETNFRGTVLMTEPTLHFGRIFMEEMIDYLERTATSRGSKRCGWKDVQKNLPYPLCNVSNPKSWRTLYSREQMESSLSKVTMVGFSEQKDIFGILTASPSSSGYCIGSSNWSLSSGFEKIVYISSSSTLTTHLKQIEKDPLRNASCIILTSMIQAATKEPDPMLAEFCKTVIDTVKQGGNALVPCYPSGAVYDLFECLAVQMDITSLSNVPMFFISPVADASLAYSNIMGEWLSSLKLNKVYLPEEPFIHGSLTRNNRLKCFKNLYDEDFSNEYRQPCVMFCGHPSLRFGDVIHFIELWGSNPNNTIVFTEPSFPYLEALAPFQPLHMKAVYCPIDTCINFNQAKTLIRDLKPGMLVIPEVYTVPPSSLPQRKDLTLEVDIPRFVFDRYESIELPLKIHFEQINLDPMLAAGVTPIEVRPGVALASVIGSLEVTNNRYTLNELPKLDTVVGKKRRQPGPPNHQMRLLKISRPNDNLYGKLNIHDVVKKLASYGVSDVVFLEEPNRCVLNLKNSKFELKFEDGAVNVICDSKDSNEKNQLRKKITEAIVSCLNKF